MAKKKKNRRDGQPRKRGNAAEVATEIRKELRGIFRRMDELRSPIAPELDDGAPEDKRYVLRKLAAYEAIQENVTTLAGMVWHLRDRLKRWMSASKLECKPTIDEIVADHKPLLICRDLFDSKKHGEGCNSSGFTPRLGSISFHPRKIGIRLDGGLKVSDLRVANPDPIPYTVEIISGDDKVTFGNAIDVICKAFEQWRILIETLDLLGGSDNESVQLRRLFKRFERGEAPIFQSELIG